MNKIEVIDKIKNKEISLNKLHHIKKLTLFYNKVIKFNNKYFKGQTTAYTQKLYNYIYNMKEFEACSNESCNNRCTKFKGFFLGYTNYCSNKCVSSSKKIKEIKEKTTIKNLGVKNPFQSEIVKEKIKQTNLKKYGVEHISQDKEIKEKIKQTNLKKYGVEYISQSKEIKEKIKQTNLKKYGVEYAFQSKEIKEKIKKTNLKKYGVANPTKTDIVKNKIKQTNLKKYGVESYIMSNEFKEKSKQTNLKKYGVEHSLQNKLIIEKIKQTNLERYGVDWYSKSNNFKNKHHKKTIKLFAERLSIPIDNIKYNGMDNDFIIKNYCSKHNQFEIPYAILRNRINYGIKNICTICNSISEQISIKEGELKKWVINDLNISNVLENNKKLLDGKEIDIYLPDYEIGIEFNGLYWHSEQYKEDNYHLNKTNLAKSKGIELIQIFEDEWLFKENIVKSIIKSKLGLMNNKFFARKTVIKEITSNESRDFLNKNHIQGNVDSSIRLGLYYNNNLVSLMTFGKKRKIMGSKSENGHYEMYRFCNELNTSILGGASKLFKYFVNTYQPKEVISYADKRYFTGKMYENLNFTLEGETKPNYFYFKQNTYVRYHRFNFRKNVLVKEGFDSNKTERKIMQERNYLRIYDCGNYKYKFIL